MRVLLGFVLSALVQLTLIVLGIAFALDQDEKDATFYLLAWCIVASAYTTTCIVILAVSAARSDRAGEHRPLRMEISRPARIVSFTATLLTSFVGLGAAVQLLSLRSDPEYGGFVDFVGVWSMLLAWGLLHWGFAQIYYQTYYARPAPPLRFPATPTPRMVDFVYFAFTVGTSFAASDVETIETRIRWRITWHSVVSFFFNGLIIVLALNTIMGG